MFESSSFPLASVAAAAGGHRTPARDGEKNKS